MIDRNGRGVGVRVTRLAFAALTTSAIVYQLTVQVGRGASAANFFSFFTILSNVGAVVVLAGLALAPGRLPGWWGALRGAVTFYMVVTGIIYALLLSGVAVGLTATWVNDVLHRVMPLVMLLDWLLVAGRRIRARGALAWLAFPIVYCAYSLARGPIVDWYPYPFLDPREPGGYGRVAAYVVGIAVAFVLLGPLIARVGRTGIDGDVSDGATEHRG